MSEFETFGGNWSLGGMVVEDVIAWPIRNWMHNELRGHGIDPDNFERRGAAISASAVGGFVGSMMGGPMGILLGLLGYTLGMSSGPSDGGSAERHLEQAVVLKAAEYAVETLKTHVDYETWAEIRDEVQRSIEYHMDDDCSVEDALRIQYEAIARVDSRIAENWLRVFRVAAREGGA